MSLYPHHEKGIAAVCDFFRHQEGVDALLLGGSIAHGYARENSDIDIMILVGDRVYEERKARDELLFFNRELAGYEEGYVDGKYICPAYLETVIAKGNDATRYAFKDARVLFARNKAGVESAGAREELECILDTVTRFDESKRDLRAKRFWAQIHAWKWYLAEATKHENPILKSQAACNLALFASRFVLNHSRMLYPYLKWLSREVAKAPDKPEGFQEKIDLIVSRGDVSTAETLVEELRPYVPAGIEDWQWSRYFLEDVETLWMRQEPPVADV